MRYERIDLGVHGPATVTADTWDRGHGLSITTPTHNVRVHMSTKGEVVGVLVYPSDVARQKEPGVTFQMRAERGPRYWIADIHGWRAA